MENSSSQIEPSWERAYKRGDAPDLGRVRSHRRLRLAVFSALKRDFGNRCCYCTGSTNEKGGEENFDIEHFRPKSRPEFASLAFTYSNLYYACRGCNLAKGARWPDPEDLEKWFIDPCEEALYPQYLRISESGQIVAQHPPGPYLVDVFRFKERVGLRKILLIRSYLVKLRTAIREERYKDVRAISDEMESVFRDDRRDSDTASATSV